MKTRQLSLAVLLLIGTLRLASAQPETSFDGVLSGTGPASCHHVINMLLHYGVQTHAQVPDVDSVLLGEAIGDLALMQVAMLDPGSVSAGPTMAVTLRNDSVRAVESFSVTAVAVFAKINPWSPSVTQRVKCVAPGEAIEVQLHLPLESLAMGRAGGELLAFNKLVVAIDSFDELLESNESNNLVVIDRERIPLVTPAVEAEAPAAAVPPQVETPSESTPLEPADPLQRPRVRVEDIDLDELGMGQ